MAEGFSIYTVVRWAPYDEPPEGFFVAVAAGSRNYLALHSEGGIRAWEEGTAPPGGTGYVQVSSGGTDSLALRDDGSIIRLSGPAMSGEGYRDVSAGYVKYLALRPDGTVVSFPGYAPPDEKDFTRISSKGIYNAGLTVDGRVFTWLEYAPAGLEFKGFSPAYHFFMGDNRSVRVDTATRITIEEEIARRSDIESMRRQLPRINSENRTRFPESDGCMADSFPSVQACISNGAARLAIAANRAAALAPSVAVDTGVDYLYDMNSALRRDIVPSPGSPRGFHIRVNGAG